MRKSLLYLFAMFCAAALLTACGDDDKSGIPGEAWKEISKTYEGKSVALSIGDVAIPVDGKSVVIEAKSAEKATVTLNNVLPESRGVTVEVTLTEKDAVCSFSGETTVSDGVVSINGMVKDGIASVVCMRKVTVPVIGSWNLNYVEVAGNKMADLYIYVETGSAEIDAMINGMLPGAAGQMMAKKVAAVSLSLLETGTPSVSWRKVTGESGTIDAIAKLINLQYCVVDHHFFLVIDKNYVSLLTAFSKQMLDKLGIHVEDLTALLVDLGGYYGLPLQAKAEGNNLRLYADKNVIVPVLLIVTPIINPLIPGNMASLVNGILQMLPNAKTVNVGLNLSK